MRIELLGMAIENGTNSFNFNFVGEDGLVIDKLLGSDGVKIYSIQNYPPEVQEKLLGSGRQLVSYIRKSWARTDREADVVGDCLMKMLHWATITFYLGFHLGVVAKTDEPERFAKRPKVDVV